jgi:hypothetical protein
MSRVISFRLNNDNPREVQARAVLKAWVDKGYGVRHVLTEALLAFDGSNKDMDIHGLSVKLDQISKMLQRNGSVAFKMDDKAELSDSFIGSIKKAAKPGVSLG